MYIFVSWLQLELMGRADEVLPLDQITPMLKDIIDEGKKHFS